MSNEIVKVETNMPTIQAPVVDSNGMSSSDLVIPRVLLMQNTSELVGDDKAKLGDMVDSETGEVLGGFGSPIHFVPLKAFKTLITYSLADGTPKFMRQEPMTAALAALRYEGTENGIPVKRMHCINVFVALMEDLKRGETFPKLISFRSSSMHVGKLINTHLYKKQVLRAAPYSTILTLGSKKEKKDTNTYAVYELGKPAGANEYLDQCVDLMMIIGSTKVADDRVTEESKPAAQPITVASNEQF